VGAVRDDPARAPAGRSARCHSPARVRAEHGEKDHFTDFFQEDAWAGSAGPNVVTDAAGLNWASSSASIGRFCVEIAVLRP
jgi:hypothetical protein